MVPQEEYKHTQITFVPNLETDYLHGSTECTEEISSEKREETSQLLRKLASNQERQEAQMDIILGEFRLVKKLCSDIRSQLSDLQQHMTRPAP